MRSRWLKELNTILRRIKLATMERVRAPGVNVIHFCDSKILSPQ